MEKSRTASYSIRANSEKEKADYKAQILKLEGELENYLTEINELRAGNDILKQELDTEKMKNDSIQTNNDKLLQELDTSKLTVKTLEINAEKFRNALGMYLCKQVCVYVRMFVYMYFSFCFVMNLTTF